MPKAGDEPREAKSAQVLGQNTFQGKNSRVPAEAFEGVVKTHRSRRPRFFLTKNRQGPDGTPSTGAVGQVLGGIRRQHVSRSSSGLREPKKMSSAEVKLEGKRWRALRDWPKRNGTRDVFALLPKEENVSDRARARKSKGTVGDVRR